MNEHAILKEIKSGKIFPLYLFFGPEKYLVDAALNQVINLLVETSSRDFNLNSYHAESSSPAEVLDTVRTLPFMTERRVVVVKKVDTAGKSFINNENLLNYLKSPYKETCLIFTAQEIDKRKKFYTLISKKGKVICFQKFRSHQTISWISIRAKEAGYNIQSAAARYIADVFDNNLNKIDTELEKIFLYSDEVKSIDLNTVQLVAGNPRVDSIFELTGAIGEKNLHSSLNKLGNLLTHGTQPLQTLGMIVRQFRLIWQTKALNEKGVSSTQISKEIGIPPYFIGEIISQAKKFTKKNLIYVFERLLKTDVQLKSSARAPSLVMESLVIDLCLS